MTLLVAAVLVVVIVSVSVAVVIVVVFVVVGFIAAGSVVYTGLVFFVMLVLVSS